MIATETAMRPNTSALTIKLAKLYPNTSRTLLHHYLANVKHPDCFPADYKPLAEFLRLDWTADHFLAKMLAYNGTLPTQHGLHHIVFVGGLTRGKLIAGDSQQMLTLSFRHAKPEFELPSYVLVTLKKDN